MLKKLSLGEKLWAALQNHHGGLAISNGSVEQTSISATPSIITGWAIEMPSCGCVLSNSTTNTIIVSEDRDYFVTGNFYFTGQITKNYLIELYVNGIDSGANITVRVATALDAVGGGYSGIITLNKNDVLDLRISSDDGGASFTPTAAQWVVEGK